MTARGTTSTTPIAINKAIEEVIHRDRGRLMAGLVARLGDIQLAEDALQDALISAMSHWGRSGLPHSPIGWLMKVALNKGIDRIRANQRDVNKTDQYMTLHPSQFETIDVEPIPDDRLRLIFACCHPVLEEKSRVALTLRTVCHLTTREIAAAFLDKDSTMGQRLSRAKEKLREADVEFEIPGQDIWPARLDSVLSTIYLIFTTGYVTEDATDRDLCSEAIFLLRLLDRLRPDDPEIEGALALVLLTEVRREARTGADGATVPPERQDRSLWDTHKITEGQSLLAQAVERGRPGPYQIKAAIADCHMADLAPDWKQISLLYGSLWVHEPTPVVALNWAVVMANLGQVDLALGKLEELADELKNFQPFYAANAKVLVLAGRVDEARVAYDKAIELAQNEGSRLFLVRERSALSGAGHA
jgi:RNA polymerase sigma-70 factor (ECF subfamily)